MGKFEGILICTDLDGTLYRNDKSVSEENKKAIEYFKSEGGYFTFVTGRMPYTAIPVYEEVCPNAPVGCINGGGVYDFQKQEYIWKVTLEESFVELVEAVDVNVPGVGIQPNAFHELYFSKDNPAMKWFRAITGAPNLKADYRNMDCELAKVVFGTLNEDEMSEMIAVLNTHPLAEKFDFIRSEKSLYEILPKGIGKGTAVEKLCQHLGIQQRKTIAIGDYFNDISMFETAGVAIAVENACPEAKEAADFVTVSNEEDAIARVIYDLEKGVFGI